MEPLERPGGATVIGRDPPRFPMELLLKIVENLDVHELVDKMIEYNNFAIGMYNESVRERLERSRNDPYYQILWEASSSNVCAELWQDNRDELLEDPVYDAMLDVLAGKLKQRHRDLTQMSTLLCCDEVIPRMKEINLSKFSTECAPLFENIRAINPDIKWNMGLENSDCINGLKEIRRAPAASGLNGIVMASAPDYDSLDCLELICKESHPDFRLRLNVATSDIRANDLQRMPAILSRLDKLSMNYYLLRVGPLPAPLEPEFSGLDLICRDHEFELSLNTASYDSLTKWANIKNRLTNLSICSPNSEELAYMQECVERGKLREISMAIENTQQLDTISRYDFPLSYIQIDTPLDDEADVSAVGRFMVKYPESPFRVSLEHAGLVPAFRQLFPQNVAMGHLSDIPILVRRDPKAPGTFDFRCDGGVLDSVRDMDLSQVDSLELKLGHDHNVNRDLITTTFSKAPAVKDLYIELRHQYEGGDSLPGLLQEAIESNFRNLERLTLPGYDSFRRLTFTGWHCEVIREEIGADVAEKLVWSREGVQEKGEGTFLLEWR